MKRMVLAFMLVSVVFTASSQMTMIPDSNFEQALINQGIDSDGILNGSVLTADISGLTNLDVSSQVILDMTGIEDFTSLQTLYCNDNNITVFDISALSNLIELNCANNANLGSLDVSQNTNLEILNCSNNGLTALDVTANTLLLELYANANQLTGLDTSFNSMLDILQCVINQITSLDLTMNTMLTELLCSDNALEGMLDLTQNSSLTTFNTTTNNSLYCIEVANAAAADAGAGIYATWLKDAFTAYSENCLDLITYVPDDAFEQYLIDQGLDDQLDNYVLTTNIAMETTVDVSSLGNVADLTGIEDFAALEELYCSGNIITELDVSQNTTLFVLDCSDNRLTDLTLNTSLLNLICDDNRLATLDVNQNTNLSLLNCSSNMLVGYILLDGLPLLTTMDATSNDDLVCIQVDNETDATAGAGQYAGWLKDAGAFYSEDCVLSSDDFLPETDVVLSPNPASHEIRLSMPYQLKSMSIYTIQGRKVLESASEIVNVEQLSRGVYFVMIQADDNRKAYKKIVISGSR